KQAGAAGSMSGSMNDSQRARGEYELLFIAVSFDIFNGVGEMMDQLVARRHALQLIPRNADAFEQFGSNSCMAMVPDVLELPFLNINERAGFTLQYTGQPAMILMRVCEDDAPDVFGLESQVA